MKLKDFIDKTLKQFKRNPFKATVINGKGHYEFDIGITSNMEVDDKSKNRVKFNVVVR